MNTKDGVSDGTSTNAMYRLMYSKRTYTPAVKKWGASDASETTQRNRMNAVGKTYTSDGFISMPHTKGEVVKSALRRVRAGGATVPKKFGLK